MQTTIPLRDLPRSKSIDRIALRAQLSDLADWELTNLIADGRLPYALNIASRHAERAELRIPQLAVQLYEKWYNLFGGRISQESLLKVPTLTPEEVTRYYWGDPIKNTLVRMTAVRRALNCKACHLYNLVTEGTIHLAPQSQQRRGPGGSALVKWTDLLAFITLRRIL